MCPAAIPRPVGIAPVSCSMSTARWAFPCRITPVLRRLWSRGWQPRRRAAGDIIANAQHAAIYVGNGMVINSQLNGTRYDPIAWVFPSSYSIRRIF